MGGVLTFPTAHQLAHCRVKRGLRNSYLFLKPRGKKLKQNNMVVPTGFEFVFGDASGTSLTGFSGRGLDLMQHGSRLS